MKQRERHLLPFTVNLVTSNEDLADAVAVRASAYLRHNAPAADKVRDGEEDDYRDDVALLIARSKVDGSALGTMRINSNLARPLWLESVMPLPASLSRSRCVEFMRLGVLNGSNGRLVSAALAKASYQICRAVQMDYILVCSRAPVDALYRGYLFDDLLDGAKLDLHYAPDVPHRVLCLPVAEAQDRWRVRSRAVHRFFVETEHPDIDIDYEEIARRFPAPAAKKKPHSGPTEPALEVSST